MSKRSYVQDLPPPGGFAPITRVANTRRKGFTNITLLAIATGIMTYGLAKYIIVQKRENEIRLTRVEERTQYAKKLEAYFSSKEEEKKKMVESTLHRAVEKRKAQLSPQES